MTLVDTSVWIDHLDRGVKAMNDLLEAQGVIMHAFVVGELAMGNLKSRHAIVADLLDMPSLSIATPREVLSFVEAYRLFERGIGYVDAHLLAAVQISPGCEFWTRDKRLRAAATDLGIASPLV